MNSHLLAACAALLSLLVSAPPAEAQVSTPGVQAVQASDGELAPPARPWDRGERPSTGLAGRIVGGIGLGLAGLNLATLPICTIDGYPEGLSDSCRAGTFALAGIFGTVGFIALVAGLSNKARHRRWLE